MMEPERSPDEIRDVLKRLAELQEVDKEILQLRHQLAVLAPKLAALDTKLAQEEQAVKGVGSNTTDSQKERSKLEKEIRELEQEIERHRKRQMEVKTNKEYAAVNQEIAVVRGKIDALETRILEMIESEESQIKRSAQARERFERFRSESGEERERIQLQIKTKKEKLERLTRERDVRRKQAPDDALRIYDRLSERHPGSVVVSAMGNQCGGCHMLLVAQKMVEIRQMAHFVRCEGCLRLIKDEEKPEKTEM